MTEPRETASPSPQAGSSRLNVCEDGSKARTGAQSSQATKLVEIGAKLMYWHSRTDEPFVTVPVRDHLENWPVRSTSYRRWLSRQFYRQEGNAANRQAVSSALDVLEAKALHDGEQQPVFTRVAGVDSVAGIGLLYLDLCNEDWEAVEISVTGWRIVRSSEVPIMFRRAPGMMALPAPQREGSVEELRSFVNVASDDDLVLLVAWLLGALRETGPYPVLCLHGEQGSAKTTQARLLRALVDPNAAPVRAEPRDPRDLVIAAKNGRIIALDNLSRVQPWLSDALCRLSTGGGFTTRALYTNDEEVIFDSQRPIILTGITELATRSDLLDRAMVLTLPRISESKRRTEREIWQAFEEAQPRILGALLDAVAVAIQDVEAIDLARVPRMADFAIWNVAAERGLPWDAGRFLTAYEANRGEINEVAMEASLVAGPVRDLVQALGGWSGTATDLLNTLESRVSDKVKGMKSWPGSARGLSAALRRLAPNLRAVGCPIEFAKTTGSGSRRMIYIGKEAESCDATDACDAGAVDGSELWERDQEHPFV